MKPEFLNKRIITSAGQTWDEWFDAPGVSDDFMTERKQPEDQIRESMTEQPYHLGEVIERDCG